MNNWKKTLLLTTVIISLTLYLKATEVPQNTYARLDINAEKAKIKLTSVKKELSKGVRLFNAKWRKDKKDFYLSSRILFNEDVWRHIKIVFKAENDGSVKLIFSGAYNVKRDQEHWFKYANIKVNGEALILNDQDWILRGGAVFITSKGSDGKDIKCIKGSCHNVASYDLSIKKDKPVIIEFDTKFIE